ncbi:hypothetical protein I3J09_19990 [Streptomyces clavuligerus]|uniref:Metalloprotease n=1 Tax=Streptomyces clavuligerus TaxID=1901 RepID=B5H0F6_STRCL|nr:protealysin inhibitor emfourin [Streptomyces clavuligerus]ANW20282.1 hypothetical protein BB341_19735 [Streptomyces clavuligerus]AXU14909.1 hypothetical protein D1794_20560 [Streptomyces clavuligerus]EDY52051.1 conserved hypothetical protein [Streptomyces clavuligerus]EFG06784.1 Hypothetical protein SCLAV_1709 [Streptomyces clavuligerus]MBY6304950.1 hypothetical protein [Streptomyces clavuligerus]
MRIQVTRTGGFAGIERQAEIDTDALPEDVSEGVSDAAGWRDLASRALAEAQGSPHTGVPDGFSYEITVDGRTVHCSDPELGEAQRELISRVLRTGA